MRRFSMLARHFIGLVALATAILTFGSASMTTTAAPSKQAASEGEMTVSDVTGTTAGGQDVTAEFIPKKFKGTKHGLKVKGLLVGEIEGVGDFKRPVTFDVKSINDKAMPTKDTPRSQFALMATCNVLNLDLGPLDLNLLGLRVQLNEVNLDITAISGAGLLGDLLCGVVNLLNGGPLAGLLRQISGLLNQILGALGGLGGGGL